MAIFALIVPVLLLVVRSYVSGEPADSQECGGLVTSPTVLSVPPLAAEQRCRWCVLAPPSTAPTPYCSVSLDLGDLSLPPCPSARLSVDGRPLCGPLPSVLRLPFRQPHTTLELRASTEGGAPFNITVRHEHCTAECDGEFSDVSVTLQSPGYPSGYRTGLDCHYVIFPSHPGVCQVQVEFENSNLEKSVNCSKDFLQINGERLCGDLLGVRTYDLSERLNIRFVSDFDGAGTGFKLKARQVECTDTVPLAVDNNDNDKQDMVDCEPLAQIPFEVDQGYPYVRTPYPQLSLPNDNWNPSLPTTDYLPPDNCDDSRINFVQDPLLLPPFRTNHQINPVPQLLYEIATVAPAFRNQGSASGYLPPTTPGTTFQRGIFFNPPGSRPLLPNFSPTFSNQPGYPQSYQPNYSLQPTNYNLNLPQNYLPTYPQNYQPTYPQNYQPTYPQNYQPTTQNHQCCGVSYSDSHFLLVSPGFPRSEASDCIYSVKRYSQLTYQIRFQFRYFWTGVDSGAGCSGGYLEIDGTRFCGCKTGLIWTTPFVDSESSKILHLKLDSASNRLFNGFVIEVFQDDSYARRSRDAELSETSSNVNSRVENFTQIIDTRIERYPLRSAEDSPSSQLVWDSSRQAWSFSPDSLCLRWSLQDWLLLAKEALWAQYQCPVSNTSSGVRTSYVTGSATSAVKPADCLICQQFCHGNCQCC